MSKYNIFFLKLKTTKHLRHTRGNMSRVYTTLVISYYLTSLVPPASSDCDTRKKPFLPHRIPTRLNVCDLEHYIIM